MRQTGCSANDYDYDEKNSQLVNTNRVDVHDTFTESRATR
jgi:hypothetical protein